MDTNQAGSVVSSRRAQYKKPFGAYVPPAKRVKSEKFDVGSEDQQRQDWDNNKKKITGLINRASSTNITTIIGELFQCNLIRYKGLFASALLKAQETSPVFTDVYAAILAVINSRIERIGLLVVNRLILQYRIAFVNNNKPKCLAAVKFFAHLTNQEVIHEVLAFQLIDHLIDKPSPASIEIAIMFLKECGAKLDQLNSPYLFEVFKEMRELSLENDFDPRIHELIDLIHVIRKDKFRDFPPVKKALDLIDDKVTHKIELVTPSKEDFHMEYNYFKFDPNWSENESKYMNFKKSLLGEDEEDNDDDDEDDDDDGDEGDDGEDESSTESDSAKAIVENNSIEIDKKDVKVDQKVIDKTQRDIIEFRKMVYSTIRSSIRHEEVVHKLLKARIEPELNEELCQMIIDFCGQMGHYESILGLVASKLCQINRREYAPRFERIFQLFYETIHRFEQNKIRNIAKFYAHLLTTESIDWLCLSCLKLRANATSSCGRCFISFLFQELVSILSLTTLIEYIHEPTREKAFNDLFPKDNEEDIRFAINFFTCCGLGRLTEDMRQVLEINKS